jgi:hypothetical protein
MASSALVFTKPTITQHSTVDICTTCVQTRQEKIVEITAKVAISSIRQDEADVAALLGYDAA